MAQLHVRRLGYALGAEVRGVDLSQPLDAATFGEIHRLWLEHLVLCFPDQHLDKTGLASFAGRFGEVDDNPHSKTRDPENSEIILLTNKPIAGRPWDGYKEGQSWHSDHSVWINPTLGTFVLAKEVPEVGGDTMFANQYMAYETLSPAMQELIEDLDAVHDIAKAKGREIQSAEVLANYEREYPPVVHPVVMVHPETKRKALYVGDRVRQIAGMTQEESAPLLGFLTAHAVRYEFLYRHRWRPNDLIMWDNRCMMHLALSDYDMRTQVRHLWRCSVSGPACGEYYNGKHQLAGAAATS